MEPAAALAMTTESASLARSMPGPAAISYMSGSVMEHPKAIIGVSWYSR